MINYDPMRRKVEKQTMEYGAKFRIICFRTVPPMEKIILLRCPTETIVEQALVKCFPV